MNRTDELVAVHIPSLTCDGVKTEIVLSEDQAKLAEVREIPLARLAKLAAAEREGNIPKLKLGDKVYWPTGCFAFLYGEIAECTISMVSIGSNTKGWKYRAFMYPKAERARGKDQQDFSESEIGKEFFLTREAAEAALAGKETDNATANDTTTRSQSTQRDDDTPTARACG